MKEKTADKMFEELGYKKSKNIVEGTFGYRNNLLQQIVFYGTKEILKINNVFEVEGITIDELQAINKKMPRIGVVR